MTIRHSFILRSFLVLVLTQVYSISDSQEAIPNNVRFEIREEAKKMLNDFEQFAGFQRFGKLYPEYEEALGRIIKNDVRFFNDLEGRVESGPYLELDEYAELLKEKYPNGITVSIIETDLVSIVKEDGYYLYTCKVEKQNSGFSAEEGLFRNFDVPLELHIAISADFSDSKIVLIDDEFYRANSPDKPELISFRYNDQQWGYHVSVDSREKDITDYFVVVDNKDTLQYDERKFLVPARANSLKTMKVWVRNSEGLDSYPLTQSIQRVKILSFKIEPWVTIRYASIPEDTLIVSKSNRNMYYGGGISFACRYKLSSSLVLAAKAGTGLSFLALNYVQVSGYQGITVRRYDKMFFNYWDVPLSFGLEYKVGKQNILFANAGLLLEYTLQTGENIQSGDDDYTYKKYSEQHWSTPGIFEFGLRTLINPGEKGKLETINVAAVVSIPKSVHQVYPNEAGGISGFEPGYWTIGLKLGVTFGDVFK